MIHMHLMVQCQWRGLSMSDDIQENPECNFSRFLQGVALMFHDIQCTVAKISYIQFFYVLNLIAHDFSKLSQLGLKGSM